MALSEFRYNKKRKHFSYIFGQSKNKRKNFLLTSKSVRKRKRKNGTYKEYPNIKLYRHPNSKSNDDQYVIPIIYYDELSSFGDIESDWKFHLYDKRKIKRIQKNKWK